MNLKTTLLICIAILVVGMGVTAFIFLTEPTAERSGAVKQTAMLVEVTQAEQGSFRPTIRALGTVEPAQEVVLSSRVGGEVVARSSSFVPGGYVRRGEVLLRLDPSDYRNVLRQRQSALRQAQSELDLEMGRQDVARRDFELLGDSVANADESLVLRQPQLEAARARVESAEAAVEQAELDLQRTTVRAPFDAHVLSRDVELGSQVDAGDVLGRLVGIETYWVSATVPLSQLRWLPDGEARDEVLVRDPTAWQEGRTRRGRLLNVVGALEDGTRMARVLIAVPDPHGLGDPAAPRLVIGSFVEADIAARELADVVRLSRDYLREDDTVWVMEDSTLRIRDVDIVFRDPTYAYIERGLSEQDRVVTTNLSTVTDGARLRLEAWGTDTQASTADEPRP
jgi:RND family efflux transporter MFP subunit